MKCDDPWLSEIRLRFQTDKTMAEKAISQLTDDELRQRPTAGINSVAIIMRHVGGNLRSRWTDFLATDGEKPDRDRECEFADWSGSRAELVRLWDRGFAILFDALDSLRAEDLSKTVTIRSEPHSVPRAIIRSLDHTAYHVGQILMIARMVHRGKWDYITIAPGDSNAFNRQKSGRG